MSDRKASLLAGLVEAAREAGAEGLVASTSGNFSVRVDSERFAVSAARSRLGRLREDEILVLPVDGREEDATAGSSRSTGTGGAVRPSRETPMHRALYSAYPDLACVLHFQSPAATALACSTAPLPDLNFIPEFPVYVRKTACVPFLAPGSDELARAVVDAFRDREVRLVQLRNHGQVVVGDDPAQAVERGVFFELACGILILAEPPKELRRYAPGELRLLRSY